MPSQSVRFSASGQDYVAELDPELGVTFTVLCWFKRAVDRNFYSTVWSLDRGSGSTGAYVQTNSGGDIMRLSDSSTSFDLFTVTSDTWYCFAVTRSATSGSSALRAQWGTDPGDMDSATRAPAAGWASSSFDTLRIGETVLGGEWLNGNVAYLKVYSRVLSDAEIVEELSYYEPVSTDGLFAAYSFWDGPSTTDLSGNGHTLSGGSGTSAEPGPGIPLSPSTSPTGPRPRLFLPF